VSLKTLTSINVYLFRPFRLISTSNHLWTEGSVLEDTNLFCG